jgi:hypothetical protein
MFQKIFKLILATSAAGLVFFILGNVAYLLLRFFYFHETQNLFSQITLFFGWKALLVCFISGFLLAMLYLVATKPFYGSKLERGVLFGFLIWVACSLTSVIAMNQVKVDSAPLIFLMMILFLGCLISGLFIAIFLEK